MTAMEMTKWFDTNYHYIVPELGPETSFSLSSTKPFDEHAEAMEELGIDTVPVIVGPGLVPAARQVRRRRPEDFDRLGLIEPLLEVYGEVIERLAEQGATWVQLDEPCFVAGPLRARAGRAAARLRGAGQGPRAHPDPASRPTSTTPATRTACCATCRSRASGWTFIAGEPMSPGHGAEGPKNVELIADEGGLEDKWLFAGHRRRPQRLDQRARAQPRPARRPARSVRRAGRLHVLLASAHPRRPRRRAALGGARRRAALVDGLRHARRWARSRPWPAGSARAGRRSPASWTPTTGRSRTVATPIEPATRRSATGSRR